MRIPTTRPCDATRAFFTGYFGWASRARGCA